MRHALPAVLALTLALAAPAVAADKTAPAPAAAARTVVKDGWPDTPAGALGRAYVAAFGAGDKEMRAFLAASLAEASLEEKSLDERLKTYRASREKFGKLMIGGVEKSSPGELQVTLLTLDGTPHSYVFKTQTSAPYKLLSIGRLEKRQMHGGFHH